MTATALVDRGIPVDNRRLTTLIAVRTDDGLVGYGEANATPLAVKALVESRLGRPGAAIGDASILETLVGRDPTEPALLAATLKAKSPWSCRTGLGHVALAGVEMALWDLCGKILGKPVWELLGGDPDRRPLAYVTIYHGPGPYRRTLDLTLRALDEVMASGYRAAKVEPLANNTANSDEIVGLIEGARKAVGPDFMLLADVGYRWTDPEEAIDCVRRVDDVGLFLLEAPFAPDEIGLHERLAAAVRTPLSSGDMLTAMVDYLPLLGSPSIRYVQAGSARTGISDMRLLAEAAAARGKGLIPWGFVPTELSAAANLHVSLALDNVPMIEHAPAELYPESRIRSELCYPALQVVDGQFVLPRASGLGVEVRDDVLRDLTLVG